MPRELRAAIRDAIARTECGEGMMSDNLAIALCAYFEVDDYDEPDESGWSDFARAEMNKVLDRATDQVLHALARFVEGAQS